MSQVLSAGTAAPTELSKFDAPSNIAGLLAIRRRLPSAPQRSQASLVALASRESAAAVCSICFLKISRKLIDVRAADPTRRQFRCALRSGSNADVGSDTREHAL